jgi:RNA polymerase sigma factor (sigma-70 family)
VPTIPAVLRSPELANDYTELSSEQLLRICADLRDAAAWSEFIRRLHATIFTAVLRTGRRYAQFHRGLCDDLVQETYLRLSAHDAKALREFEPRHPGSAQSYLWVIAARVTQDYCKSKNFRRTEELPPDPPDAAAPGKAEWLALKAAIGDVLRKHAVARDRQIFGLHFLQGMSAREIAEIPGIGLKLKGVESAIDRLKDLIRENLGGAERESRA